ncbi:MAG: hypothetical protein GF333_04225 [Candidatus Omnitrophica bacterium]|nr:hypothetical protein [Candidatus Omnitrophota bacterium]
MRRKKHIRSILVNFPTNLGDVILTFPAVDALRASYFQSRITAISSPQSKTLLLANRRITEVAVFKKQWRLKQKKKFACELRGRYDLVVDFKNSLLPFVTGGRHHTPFIRKFPSDMHQKDRYLSLIRRFCDGGDADQNSIELSPVQQQQWENFSLPRAIFVSCASRSPFKRYPYRECAQAVKKIAERYPVAVVGEERDRDYYGDILSRPNVYDLVGKTSLPEVFFLMKRYCDLLVSVDSAILHIASYLNLPVVALFGPTDPRRYGPFSRRHRVLRRDMACAACRRLTCEKQNDSCMHIDPQSVVDAAEEIRKGHDAQATEENTFDPN